MAFSARPPEWGQFIPQKSGCHASPRARRRDVGLPMVVGALFRLRLSRRAQCEKNVETGDEHTMRMRFQSRKSDTSRNKATNFPRNTAPSRQPIFGLWYLTQHRRFRFFAFPRGFHFYYISKRALTPRRTARDVHTHTHTSTSTTLDRLVRQHRTTHFESSDSATERFCEPSIETLSREEKTAFLRAFFLITRNQNRTRARRPGGVTHVSLVGERPQ